MELGGNIREKRVGERVEMGEQLEGRGRGRRRRKK
jgi:hypothetical protein